MDTGNFKQISVFCTKKKAENLCLEYLKAIGDKKYFSYLRKKENLDELKVKLSYATGAVIVLAHKESQEMINTLIRLGFLKKGEEYSFKKLEPKLKKISIDIQIKQKEFDTAITSMQSSEKQSAVKAAYENVVALSRWLGYRVDLEKLTAFEYAKMLNENAKEAEKWQTK